MRYKQFAWSSSLHGCKTLEGWQPETASTIENWWTAHTKFYHDYDIHVFAAFFEIFFRSSIFDWSPSTFKCNFVVRKFGRFCVSDSSILPCRAMPDVLWHLGTLEWGPEIGDWPGFTHSSRLLAHWSFIFSQSVSCRSWCGVSSADAGVF